MRRFTVYRRGDLSATHGDGLVNAPDLPQYEGIIFTDGICVLRWLTAYKSTSVWTSFEEAMAVHGHFQHEHYGTFIEFHDGEDRCYILGDGSCRGIGCECDPHETLAMALDRWLS